MTETIAPEHNLSSYNCPHCKAYAHQQWYKDNALARAQTGNADLYGFTAARCAKCNLFTIWFQKKMIHPADTNAPTANKDIPEDILIDYNEARQVLVASPRAAAALLRLVIQKLNKHLGLPGKNINDDIGTLVAKGLPKFLQEALDVVRVTGNNAVHPGELDLRDDEQAALQLFTLINLIVDNLITQPELVAKLFNNLPEKDKKAIEKRDLKPNKT